MSDIDWSQKRKVYYSDESGDYFVKVSFGYMEADDYIEGGPHCKLLPKDAVYLGEYSNADILTWKYVVGKHSCAGRKGGEASCL